MTYTVTQDSLNVPTPSCHNAECGGIWMWSHCFACEDTQIVPVSGIHRWVRTSSYCCRGVSWSLPVFYFPKNHHIHIPFVGSLHQSQKIYLWLSEGRTRCQSVTGGFSCAAVLFVSVEHVCVCVYNRKRFTQECFMCSSEMIEWNEHSSKEIWGRVPPAVSVAFTQSIFVCSVSHA